MGWGHGTEATHWSCLPQDVRISPLWTPDGRLEVAASRGVTHTPVGLIMKCRGMTPVSMRLLCLITPHIMDIVLIIESWRLIPEGEGQRGGEVEEVDVRNKDRNNHGTEIVCP